MIRHPTATRANHPPIDQAFAPGLTRQPPARITHDHSHPAARHLPDSRVRANHPRAAPICASGKGRQPRARESPDGGGGPVARHALTAARARITHRRDPPHPHPGDSIRHTSPPVTNRPSANQPHLHGSPRHRDSDPRCLRLRASLPRPRGSGYRPRSAGESPTVDRRPSAFPRNPTAIGVRTRGKEAYSCESSSERARQSSDSQGIDPGKRVRFGLRAITRFRKSEGAPPSWRITRREPRHRHPAKAPASPGIE